MWTRYSSWTGAVNGARIRVPIGRLSVPAYGLSENPLVLRAGAAGKILNIIPSGASKPPYVQFRGVLNLDYAGEVLIRRSENTITVWRDLVTRRMDPNETTVLVLRK